MRRVARESIAATPTPSPRARSAPACADPADANLLDDAVVAKRRAGGDHGVTYASWAQLTDAEKSAVLIQHDYEVNDNITYKVANSYEAKLDVYRPREAKTPTPVVVMIHGGGWVAGTKEGAVLYPLPFMTLGFAVVNVE